MPIKPKKIRLYKGAVDPNLILFVDARYSNSFANDGSTSLNNLAIGNTPNVGNATLTNVVWDNEEEGCFILDGSTKYISINSNTLAFGIFDSLTISAYVKPGIPNQYLGATIFNSGLSNNTNFTVGYGSPSNPNRFFYGGAGALLYSTRTYPINQWYYITWTKRKVSIQPGETHEYKFYVNGILEDTFIGPSTGANETKATIGRGNPGVAGESFGGKIAQVKVWQKTLSAPEVISDFVSSQIKPFTLGSKSTSRDIILFLNERGTRSGWGDNSVYSNGSVISGNATFDSGLITNGVDSPASYAQGTLTTDPGQNFTISATITCNGVSTSIRTIQTFFVTNPSNGLGTGSPTSTGISLSLDETTKSIYFLYGNSAYLSSPTNIFQFGETFNATATVQQSGGSRIMRLYKNGVFLSTTTISTTFDFTNRVYRIGYYGYNGFNNPTNGKIHNVLLYNRTLSNTEVNNLYVSLPTTYRSSESTYNQEPTATRLLYVDCAQPSSYYLTGTTFSDISGFNRHGSITQSTVTQGVTTVSGTLPTFSQFNGGYFYFNGFKTANPLNTDQTGNSFIKFPISGLPSGVAPSTIIAWARAKASEFSTTTRYIFSYGSTTFPNQTRYVGIKYPDLFSVGAYGTTGGLTFSGLVPDQWFQISFVYDNSRNMCLYVNGELKIIKNFSLTTNASGTAYIGRNNTTLGVTSDPLDGYFYGDIAQVTLYNRALTEQEIYQHYKTTRDRFGASEVIRPTSVAGIFAPQVTTINPNTLIITNVSAQSGVIINFNGNANISSSGILYRLASQTGLFEWNGPNVTSIIGASNQILTISSLSQNTQYQVRAFAYNGTSFGYGGIIDFTTGLPSALTLVAVTASFTGNYATGSGQVSSLGGSSNYTVRGFVWSTSTINVATADTLPDRVIETKLTIPLWSSTSEVWKLRIPTSGDLLPGTTYYLRSYANVGNSANVYSNNELVFTTYTFAIVTVTIPTATNQILGDTAYITGDVTNSVGSNVIQRGIVWSEVNLVPTIENDSKTSNGTSTGIFTGTLNGLSPNTTYYVRAYAINSAGISYSDVKTFTTDSAPIVTTDLQTNLLDISATLNGTQNSDGNSPVTQRGFIWISVEQPGNTLIDIETLDTVLSFTNTTIYTPTFINFTTNLSTPSFSSGITGLTRNKGYAFRAYAYNGVDYAYGLVLSFTTLDYAVVTTGLSQNPSTSQVTLNGSISSIGNAPSASYGFYVGSTNNPLTKTTLGTIDSTTSLPFNINGIVNLTGFSQGNTVYYRAFVDTIVSNPLSPNPNNDFVGGVNLFTIPTLVTPATLTIGTVSIFSTANNSRFRLETTLNSAQQGTNPISEKGIVWGSTLNPTIADNVATGFPLTGNGVYSATYSSLILSVNTFQIAAYAKNNPNTYYYTLGYDFVTHYLDLSLSLNGLNIDATATPGASPVRGWVVRGFVWNTTGDPKIENGDNISILTGQQGGNAAFSKASIITNINGNTTYYVRAFARTNASSTGLSTYIYSIEKAYPPNGVPTVTITPQFGWYNTNIVSNAMLFEVILNIQMNGNTDTENGIVWSTSLNPTTTTQTGGGKQIIGSGVYNSTTNIYTPTFTDNTNYYFRGYTIVGSLPTYSDNFVVRTLLFASFALTVESNNDITANANVTSVAGWDITNRGFVYTTNSQDPFISGSVITKTLNTTGFGAFTDTMVSPTTNNTTYIARAWVDLKQTTSNNTIRIYSNTDQKTISISVQVPTITLASILDLFVDAIIPNGSMGGVITMTLKATGISGNPTQVGFEWSTTPTFTSTRVVSFSTGGSNNDYIYLFGNTTGNLMNVSTTYYMRAFVTNSLYTRTSLIDTFHTFVLKLNSVITASKGRLSINYTIPSISQPIQQIDLYYYQDPIVIVGQPIGSSEVVWSSGQPALSIGPAVSNTYLSQLQYISGYYIRFGIKVSGFDRIVYSNQIQLA